MASLTWVNRLPERRYNLTAGVDPEFDDIEGQEFAVQSYLATHDWITPDAIAWHNYDTPPLFEGRERAKKVRLVKKSAPPPLWHKDAYIEPPAWVLITPKPTAKPARDSLEVVRAKLPPIIRKWWHFSAPVPGKGRVSMWLYSTDEAAALKRLQADHEIWRGDVYHHGESNPPARAAEVKPNMCGIFTPYSKEAA